jgi:hypothetical protein
VGIQERTGAHGKPTAGVSAVFRDQPQSRSLPVTFYCFEPLPSDRGWRRSSSLPGRIVDRGIRRFGVASINLLGPSPASAATKSLRGAAFRHRRDAGVSL